MFKKRNGVFSRPEHTVPTVKLVEDDLMCMFQLIQQGLVIRGYTFHKKELIKQAGGLWDPIRRQWVLPSKEAMLSTGAVPTGGNYWVFPREETANDNTQEDDDD